MLDENLISFVLLFVHHQQQQFKRIIAANEKEAEINQTATFGAHCNVVYVVYVYVHEYGREFFAFICSSQLHESLLYHSARLAK